MTMLTILLMTAIVFISRYLFLEPALPLRLNAKMQRLLNYSGPAILTAIWGPIVFAPEGDLQISLNNPYLLAACVAAFLVWKSGNLLLSIALSMGFFMLLNLVLPVTL